MKASAAQMRAQLAGPDPKIRLFLLYGPDESGASDTGTRLAGAMGPDIEKIDINSKELKDSPGRLADEAASLSLFGERRLIRIFGAEDSGVEAFRLLLDADAAENPVIATGPALKNSSKLVKLAIASPLALAQAFYVPEGQDAARLAINIARDHGLRLTGDTAQQLASAAAGDRAILSREIEKLALFLDAGPERPRDADALALEAIGADIGEPELFRTIETIVEGRVREIGDELTELNASGGSGIPLLRMLTRRLITLAELRAQVDAGASIEQATEKTFFREKPATIRALKRWNSRQLAHAINRARRVERDMMHGASAGEVLAEAECAAIARAAARMR
ncbi:DNA polymerase III subunit delta [Stakelama tenebrarum]|uniref:DNA-directed DNA polymerase n=1 Tax=Stakelama tenebrarum TaxID=2711215 RepID=A0A6G6Y0X3_9SPHN|nr:DNA polymerase III subunit delta [Sphingosinithalassobacter tenebrarum]QIG78549.1 DNA polymerase III subunit delta [Sphingosinithalassobacter tenebrarum]